MWLAASPSVSSWALALLGVAIVGFWRPYLSRIGTGVDVLTHVHAATVTGWMLLLAGQPFLIRQRRRGAHRALGRVSYALMPVILATAIALAVYRLRTSGADLSIDRAELFFVQVGTTALLTAFYILAMIHRQEPVRHARYMIGTGLVMIDPIMARVFMHVTPSLAFLAPHVIWIVTTPALIALIALEAKGHRSRSPFVWQLMLLALFQVSVSNVGRSEMWMSFARSLAAV